MQIPSYLPLTSPGVYLQAMAPAPELELLPGIPLFLGVAQMGHPYDRQQAIKLTLWTQFVDYFGDPLPHSYLGYAVRGFFENGGHCCFVIPLGDDTPAELERGLEVAETLNQIDLVCAPDLVRHPPDLAIALQALVLEHCDRMGDRFAILDGLPGGDRQSLAYQKQRLVGDSGALYTPWLRVEGLLADYVPACGHVAGVYARNDARVGPHQAPANYRLEEVLDISAEFSDEDWTSLNPDQGSAVNFLRSFPSRGIRVWGARTLSQNPEWRYVNIRRLKITMRRWIEHHLTGVVFEPNEPGLWDRLKRELTVYCESLWEQGALQGNFPEEAFYIQCDEEINPPAVQDRGQVVVQIGLAPTTPSEFLVLSLIHGSNGVTLIQS